MCLSKLLQLVYADTLWITIDANKRMKERSLTFKKGRGKGA